MRKYLICLGVFLIAGCISSLKNVKSTTEYVNGAVVKTIVEQTETSGWPVAKKGVSIEQDAAFFALEVMASAETGGYPLPNIKYFRGNSAVDTLPMMDWDEYFKNKQDTLKLTSFTNYSECLTIESSYWNNSVAYMKHRRKGSGSNIPNDFIKYNMNVTVGTDTGRTNMFDSFKFW
jgi:hypothetical protein